MGQLATAALPAFLASLVEFVEALTIVLAVGATRGWRPAIIGTLAGIALLAVVVLVFGPALGLIPLASLQLVVGILLLFFGMRWLRKAILRYAGVLAMKNEAVVYERKAAELSAQPQAGAASSASLDAGAIATTFNAVVLEGLEVVFIVIAVGATARAIGPAIAGAALAGLVVVGLGFALRRPLANMPENGLKFVVGIMLTSFGTFWTGEGLRIDWPGDDLALLALVAGYLVASGLAVLVARRSARTLVAGRA